MKTDPTSESRLLDAVCAWCSTDAVLGDKNCRACGHQLGMGRAGCSCPRCRGGPQVLYPPASPVPALYLRVRRWRTRLREGLRGRGGSS